MADHVEDEHPQLERGQLQLVAGVGLVHHIHLVDAEEDSGTKKKHCIDEAGSHAFVNVSFVDFLHSS